MLSASTTAPTPRAIISRWQTWTTKEVWYSEGCATFGYSELQENKTAEYGAGTIGGYQSPLALLDSLPNAFVGSRRTMYMFQPAIGSFYEGHPVRP